MPQKPFLFIRKLKLVVVCRIMCEITSALSAFAHAATTSGTALRAGVVPNAGCILSRLVRLWHSDVWSGRCGHILRSGNRRLGRRGGCLVVEGIVVKIRSAASRTCAGNVTSAVSAVIRADVVLHATRSSGRR